MTTTAIALEFAAAPVADAPTADPSQWVEMYGDYLFRFALLRVRDETLAEDLVQETLLGAWQRHDKFAGRSSEKTWLTEILKHKIIDHYRQTSRRQTLALDDETLQDELMFEADGHWSQAAKPAEWRANPVELAENKEFWTVFQQCLSALPQRTAAAFTLREIEGLSGPEVCAILNVTPNNLWVMLHRARLQLRQELEIRWFRTRQN
jgi:RNA polymerase sigma-70 factor (ECF subfamily)